MDGGYLEFRSHNEAHYWEEDDDEFSECYFIYNNKCFIVDCAMDIIYNSQNEIIGLSYNGYQCDRIQ